MEGGGRQPFSAAVLGARGGDDFSCAEVASPPRLSDLRPTKCPWVSVGAGSVAVRNPAGGSPVRRRRSFSFQRSPRQSRVAGWYLARAAGKPVDARWRFWLNPENP